MQNDKELLLDQQIGLCFFDVNRMQESHHRMLTTAHSSLIDNCSSEQAEIDSAITKSPMIRSTSDQEQNIVMNQIVAKFHQDYRRVSSDIEAPRQLKPSYERNECSSLAKVHTIPHERNKHTLSLDNFNDSTPLLLNSKAALSASVYNQQMGESRHSINNEEK